MKTPVVSVVLPVYSFNEYFIDSLRSVTEQSYKQIEIIIVDDSNDPNLAKVVLDLKKEVKIVRGNNKGLSAALNLGITECKGAFIARMDSDDIAAPDRILKQLNYLESNNLDICGSNVHHFGVLNEKIRFPEKDNEIKFSLSFGCPIAHPSVMAKSHIFKKYPYNSNTTAAEDYDLWCRMAVDGVKFGNCQDYLLNYRMHPDQATKTNIIHHKNSIKIAKEYAKIYLIDENYSRFLTLNCGFNGGYSTQQVDEILNILIRVMKNRKVSSQTLGRYMASLNTRITDFSFQTIKNYYRHMKSSGLTLNIKIVLFLTFSMVFIIDPKKKYFSFFKWLY